MQLLSNSGWNSIILSCKEFEGDTFLASTHIAGKYWDSKSLERQDREHDLADDYEVTLKQVILSKCTLWEVVENFKLWLVEARSKKYYSFEINLSCCLEVNFKMFIEYPLN